MIIVFVAMYVAISLMPWRGNYCMSLTRCSRWGFWSQGGGIWHLKWCFIPLSGLVHPSYKWIPKIPRKKIPLTRDITYLSGMNHQVSPSTGTLDVPMPQNIPTGNAHLKHSQWHFTKMFLEQDARCSASIVAGGIVTIDPAISRAKPCPLVGSWFIMVD